eukprot:3933928-Rhodomonas_salina.1
MIPAPHSQFLTPAFASPMAANPFRSEFVPATSKQHRPMKLRAPAARPHGLETFRPRVRTSGMTSLNMAGLLITKMITSMTLMALGDMLTQYNARKSAAVAGGAKAETSFLDAWDIGRTARQGMFGAVIAAPICHLWFPMLEKLVPLTGQGLELLSHVAERVMVDQLLSGPVNLVLFLTWMSYLEDFNARKAVQKCKDAMPTLYPKSLMTWVPVHMLTFSVVPDEYRVLWIGLVSILWGAVLSATASGESAPAPAPALAAATPLLEMEEQLLAFAEAQVTELEGLVAPEPRSELAI